MIKVLFICTHNSSRSQMAEGILKNLYGEHYEAYSAGTEPSIVNPYAIRAMAEIGIDISKYLSKSLDDFRGMDFDYVVTVCDHAKETCPFFPRGKVYLHRDFDDPSRHQGKEEEILSIFRKVRDEIGSWLKETFNKKKEKTSFKNEILKSS